MSARRVLVPFATETYLEALVAAGLEPIALPDLDIADAISALDGVAGLMFTGGEDVDPTLFGEEPHPKATPPNSRRDGIEIVLARAARAQRIPALALCRGIHIMNVALGGSLIQDIPSQWPDGQNHPKSRHPDERVHRVDLEPGSRLAAVLDASTLTVNSSHHQAIRDPASPLRSVGRSPDGIIEAIEAIDPEWWMVGVQWHPEDLTKTEQDWDRRIFAAFAEQVNLFETAVHPT